MALEGVQPEVIRSVVTAVERLEQSFRETGDVTVQEFMEVSQARDLLLDVVRRMYEKCIYKDD
jgi:hypothetical protein